MPEIDYAFTRDTILGWMLIAGVYAWYRTRAAGWTAPAHRLLTITIWTILGIIPGILWVGAALLFRHFSG